MGIELTGRIRTIRDNGKRTYYVVSTSAYNGESGFESGNKKFPYTEEGLKEANAFLEKYRIEKGMEHQAKRKKTKLGILHTEKYHTGLLKYFSLHYSQVTDKCAISLQICRGVELKIRHVC